MLSSPHVLWPLCSWLFYLQLQGAWLPPSCLLSCAVNQHVRACVRVHDADHSPSAFGYILRPLMHTNKQLAHNHTNTHFPCQRSCSCHVRSAGLFLGQQLQRLLNMWALEELYVMTMENKLQFSLSWVLSSKIFSLLRFTFICKTCTVFCLNLLPVSDIHTWWNPLKKSIQVNTFHDYRVQYFNCIDSCWPLNCLNSRCSTGITSLCNYTCVRRLLKFIFNSH